MKAVVIRTFGDPAGLEVVDVPVPVVAPGQVRVATEAIGVGGVDAMIRRGALAAYGFREGHLLGSEIAGRVTEVGEGVDTSWIGRRVWASTGLSGGYAEQAVAAVDDVLPLPDDLTDADAVTLGSSGVVAHFAWTGPASRPGRRCSCGVRRAASGSRRSSSRPGRVRARWRSPPRRPNAAPGYGSWARPMSSTAPARAGARWGRVR